MKKVLYTSGQIIFVLMLVAGFLKIIEIRNEREKLNAPKWQNHSESFCDSIEKSVEIQQENQSGAILDRRYLLD